MSLIDRVRRTLRRYHLTSRTTRVVAALSGGPDSIALVHLLRVLDGEGELQLVAVAHFDHQLRDAAVADAQFCAAVAAELELPFVTDRADVRALAAASHRSVEDAAHVARHAFFARALRAQAADAVAVGHTQDDQAETFLLRLLRGAGSRGLAAMYARNGEVIRPLIECSRAEVHAFVRSKQLAFVHDASNDDVDIPRNRIRRELMPLLTSRFNPRIVAGLASQADLARADYELVGVLSAQWQAAHVRELEPGAFSIDAGALSAAPDAVAWRALHMLMSRAAGGRLIGFEDVRRARDLAAAVSGGFDAPGQRVQRLGSAVVITGRPVGSVGRPPAVSSSPTASFSHPLPVPGEVAIAEIGCVMSSEVALCAENAPRPNGMTAIVPKEKVAGGLAVRNRRAGDRVKAPAGSRKLQDLLVDRKVPRAERDRIPIVVDATGHIVWVAGHAVDWDFQVSDPAQAVVILRLKGVGGSC
jgi:tRNA(Ile)-lysidine synthase